MMILVTGGSASGKSAFAERLIKERAQAREGGRTYLATMAPGGEEAKMRIARHRKMRASLGFETVECSAHISTVVDKCKEAVLLEDLGNLVANEMFGGTEKDSWHTLPERIARDLFLLEVHCALLVVVTNEVFSDGGQYGEETVRYMEVLGEVNALAAAGAREVWEVICGIPVRRK